MTASPVNLLRKKTTTITTRSTKRQYHFSQILGLITEANYQYWAVSKYLGIEAVVANFLKSLCMTNPRDRHQTNP